MDQPPQSTYILKLLNFMKCIVIIISNVHLESQL